ncbi:MAG: nickel pincer cofactor biosynthesis protein LarB [Gemmatimonadetes bacterium]|nr:nickel pincer cofactor biosynthesis protein LarB [Gemmatimonadota bacterium]
MMRARVRALLAEVASGAVGVEDALARLDAEPIQTLADATVDHHRALRSGYPEVVYAAGKSVEQLLDICRALDARTGRFLVTRASEHQRNAVTDAFPGALANRSARTVRYARGTMPNQEHGAAAHRRDVIVVTAGTSDLPVAEEALETLAAIGIPAQRIADVGVAGIHRVMSHTETLQRAAAVIVVAGMDGALPSVIGGMVGVPVIAVPTSVGYGASFGGLAALLTMVNSCAAGVTVCNIDNGFGAAMAAARCITLQE